MILSVPVSVSDLTDHLGSDVRDLVVVERACFVVAAVVVHVAGRLEATTAFFDDLA